MKEMKTMKPIKEWSIEDILQLDQESIQNASKSTRISLMRSLKEGYIKKKNWDDSQHWKIQKPDPEHKVHYMDVDPFEKLKGKTIYFLNYIDGFIYRGEVYTLLGLMIPTTKMAYGNTVYLFPFETLEQWTLIDDDILERIRDLSTDRRQINPDQGALFAEEPIVKVGGISTINVNWDTGEITIK